MDAQDAIEKWRRLSADLLLNPPLTDEDKEKTIETSYQLLEIIRKAGHTTNDPTLRDELQDSATRLATLIMLLGQLSEFPNALIYTYESRVEKATPIIRLPKRGRVFVDRGLILQHLTKAWKDSRTRMITVIGSGGVGKTACVCHWMKDEPIQPSIRTIAWSFYSGVDGRLGLSADRFLDETLKTLGDPHADIYSAKEKGRKLADLISSERTLLILDGIEPLQHPPHSEEFGEVYDMGLRELLRSIQSKLDGLCIITSRYPLPKKLIDQPTVQQLKLPPLHGRHGVELLKSYGLKGLDQDFMDISNWLQGHPLGLTLFAEYSRRTGYPLNEWQKMASDTLTSADRRFGPGDRSPDHSSRVLSSYYATLNEPERQLMRIRSLFTTPIDRQMIEDVLAGPPIPRITSAFLDAENEIDWQPFAQAEVSLQRAQLISISDDLREPGVYPSAKVYDTHPLIVRYFSDQMKNRYENYWRQANRRLFTRLQSKFTREPQNMEDARFLYDAVIHGCLSGEYQLAYRSVYIDRLVIDKDKPKCWELPGTFADELRMLNVFFSEPWKTVVSALDSDSKRFIRHAAHHCLRALGRLSEAEEALGAIEDSLKYVRKDRRGENYSGRQAEILGSRAEQELLECRITQAIDSARTAVDYAEKSNNPNILRSRKARLAEALFQHGEWKEAQEFFQSAEHDQIRSSEMRGERRPFMHTYSGYLYWNFQVCQAEYLLRKWLRPTDLGLDARGKVTKQLVQESLGLIISQTQEAFSWEEKESSGAFSIYVIIDQALQLLANAQALTMELLQDGEPALERIGYLLTKAMNEMEMSGHRPEYPRVYLAFARFHYLTGCFDEARECLGVAQALAERGRYRIFLIDHDIESLHLSQREIGTAAFPDWQHRVESVRNQASGRGYLRRLPELDFLAKPTRDPREPKEPRAPKGKRLFVSYSHKDHAWLDRIKVILKPLIRHGLLDLWSDERIIPGDPWRDEIRKALDLADGALLLITSSFLASDFIAKNELPPLLEDAQLEDTRIFWIPVEHTLVKEVCGELTKYQSAYPVDRPLASLSEVDQQRALIEIARKIVHWLRD